MNSEDWTFETDATPTLQFSSHEAHLGLYIPGDRPYTVVICKDGQDVGELSIKDGVFTFKGNMDESAAELFVFVKRLADKYLAVVE